MKGEPPTPTRRRVLASLGGAGALSLAGGAGTLAYATDDEEVPGRLQGGEVDLRVDCDDCSSTDGTVTLPVEDVQPGETTARNVDVQVTETSNSVRLWLRSACPPVADPLGEALEARLAVERNCGGERTYPLGSEWTSFSALRRDLHDGLRLDDPGDPCAGPGDGLCLVFEYRLPGDATWVDGAATHLELEVYGQQCRHVPESGVGNGPFADESCPTLSCESCVELGKLDVVGDRLVPGRTYGLDEVAPPFDADGHDYAIEVLTVTDKVDGEDRETVCARFRLLRDGSEDDAPPMCSVTVGGGRPVPDPPPKGPPSGRTRHDVEPPLSRTPDDVCAAHAENPGNGRGPKRPAISNVTVFVCSDGEAEVVQDG